MADSEQFDLLKLLKSPFTGLYWVKSVMLGLGIYVLIIVGFAVWKAFFKKPDPTNTQNIEAQAGSNVSVTHIYERKKTLIPFVEGFAEQKSDGEKLNTGIRGGVRFEW